MDAMESKGRSTAAAPHDIEENTGQRTDAQITKGQRTDAQITKGQRADAQIIDAAIAEQPRNGLKLRPTLGEKPCPERPALQARPLLNNGQATELEMLFRLLGNTTRLKILHCLVREGELPVGELCEMIQLNTQAVSNQLRNLAASGVVMTRRCGTSIHYRVVDDCVLELLERGLCQRECVDERGMTGNSDGDCCDD